MVLDLFPEPFDVDIHCPGVTDVFISPDLIEKLFPCEDLIRGSSKEIQQLQFFRRHIHMLTVNDYGIVGKVDGDARIFYTLALRRISGVGLYRLIPAENRLDAGNKLFGIKGLIM